MINSSSSEVYVTLNQMILKEKNIAKHGQACIIWHRQEL